MKMKVKEVTTKKELREFVHFPNELYKDNPYYVPQIESMDRDTLTPSKNHAFEVCEGKYWLAYDEQDKIVGRVAGIINHRYYEKVGEKTCRFGWIDFINNRDVSEALILFPFGWYHMLKALKKNDTIDLLLIAIDEHYQNKGLNAMIFNKFAKGIVKNGIKYIESTRELEDNSQVQNLWHYLEHDLVKRARTYIKPLKEQKHENKSAE